MSDYKPIRAFQTTDDDEGQYAIVEWIAEGQTKSLFSVFDDSGDAKPYFLAANSDLIIRRNGDGFVCDVISEPDKNGHGEVTGKGLPFVIEAPELWPVEWE